MELILDYKEQPNTPPDAPVLMICHGIGGGSASRLARLLADEAAAKGWRAVVYNRRGHGESTLLPGPLVPPEPPRRASRNHLYHLNLHFALQQQADHLRETVREGAAAAAEKASAAATAAAAAASNAAANLRHFISRDMCVRDSSGTSSAPHSPTHSSTGPSSHRHHHKSASQTFSLCAPGTHLPKDSSFTQQHPALSPSATSTPTQTVIAILADSSGQEPHSAVVGSGVVAESMIDEEAGAESVQYMEAVVAVAKTAAANVDLVETDEEQSDGSQERKASLKQVQKLFPKHSDTDDMSTVAAHLAAAYPDSTRVRGW